MKYQKQIFFILFILALTLLAYYYQLPQLLTIAAFKQQKQQLVFAIAHHYWQSTILFIALYCIVIALSLPGAAALSLLSGFLFGTIPGMVYILIGATTGACFAFLIVRYLFGSYFQQRYAATLQKFNQEMNKHGAFYLLSLRLMPVFPFFLVTILAALTTISFVTFFITTTIGIIPGAFVFSFAGKQFDNIEHPADILSFEILLAFVVLGLLALVPILYKKMKKY